MKRKKHSIWRIAFAGLIMVAVLVIACQVKTAAAEMADTGADQNPEKSAEISINDDYEEEEREEAEEADKGEEDEEETVEEAEAAEDSSENEKAESGEVLENEEETGSGESSEEAKDDEDSDTKSAGSITIRSLDDEGNPQANVEYRLYGIWDNGSPGVEIEDMEGMTLYEWGREETDEDGQVYFGNLSTDPEEWYMVKNMKSGDFFHIESIPYALDYEADDSYKGKCEKEGDSYLYYDLIFTNQKGESWISIPEKEKLVSTQKTIENGAWLPLYSTEGPRKSAKVLTRVKRIKVNSSGNAEGQSFYATTGGLYMSCCEHEKGYPAYGSKGESLTEHYYTGKNKVKIRKLLYYGYGGYDHGKTYYAKYNTAAGNYFISTVLLFSYYTGHKNPFSNWKVLKNLKSFVEGQPDPVKTEKAATKISFSRMSSILHDGSLETGSDIKNSIYKDWKWSDKITLSSDGKKKMNLTIPEGIVAYVKSTKTFIEAKSSDKTFSVKAGETVKFAHKWTSENSQYKVKMTSEGGITEYEPIYGNTAKDNHQDLIRAYYQKSSTLTSTLLLEESGENPQVDSVREKGSMRQKLRIYKTDEEGNPLAGARFLVTCENGETKTVVSDKNGEASVDFDLVIESDEFYYLLNLKKLSELQLDKYLSKQNNKKTKEEALAAAKENLEEKIAKTSLSYQIRESQAPEGYLVDSGLKEVKVTGENENEEKIVFKNSSFPGILYTSKTIYFYQEIKARKENALYGTEENKANDPEYLEGAEFTVKNEKIYGGAQLVEIIYNKGDSVIEVKNDDGSALEHPHDSFIMTSARDTGLAKAAFVYALTSLKSYGYPEKEWASYTESQQKLMDSEGIYHSEKLALEAAEEELRALVKNLSCTYSLQETKAPISLSGEAFNITFPDQLTKTIGDADGSVIELDDARAKYDSRK